MFASAPVCAGAAAASRLEAPCVPAAGARLAAEFVADSAAADSPVEADGSQADYLAATRADDSRAAGDSAVALQAVDCWVAHSADAPTDYLVALLAADFPAEADGSQADYLAATRADDYSVVPAESRADS